jgi:acyl-coenzyme A thioesterase PaaI-like protein
MRVTDLAINQTLGLRLASAGAGHLLEMPALPLHLNHVGTVHASVQFALAEACSGEFLLQHLGNTEDQIFAVLRTSAVKFRAPARGELRASARFVEGMVEEILRGLTSRGRVVASVLVEIADTHDVITMTGQYDWYLQRQTHSP